MKLATSNKKKKYSLCYYISPILRNIGNIIKKNLYLLHIHEEGTKVYAPDPMISFRSARKLSSYLVRAKLHSIEQILVSFKCNGKRCQTCPSA